ncbi:hypothetical protein GOV06_04435 [Candidatus Woesearchaeota archaeon]|nr:hypothetical protein [Candidatus Woesearchaeota archaeon]
MPKPSINFWKEPLRYVCNEAFYAVKSVLPRSVYNSEKYDPPLAFGLGATAGIAAAELGKHVIFPEVIQAISKSVTLEEIITVGVISTVSLAVGSMIIAPKQVREWASRYGTYASGVTGVMAGAVGTGLYELMQNF